MSKQIGPILTNNEFMPGDPNDLNGDQSSAFNGVPGYEKGSGGKIPEVTFVDQGAFTAPKPAGKG